MNTSSEIGELAAALAAAQGEMGAASKDARNPHFKSTYASLSEVVAVSREPLARHGLAVVQTTDVDIDMGRLTLTTRIIHGGSGQWLEQRVSCSLRDASPQAIGSAQTYLMRYGRMSMLGIPAADDDGERSQGRGQAQGERAQGRAHASAQSERPQGTRQAQEQVDLHAAVNNLRVTFGDDARIGAVTDIEGARALYRELAAEARAPRQEAADGPSSRDVDRIRRLRRVVGQDTSAPLASDWRREMAELEGLAGGME